MSSSSLSSGLVVKAVHAGSTRRLTLRPELDFASFRARCAATFSLPPQGTKLSFTDDDGDEIDISSQACLREAISFFSDDEVSSNASTRSSSSRCVMRINVAVEYDGPGLSDYEPSLSDGETRWSRSHRGTAYDVDSDERSHGREQEPRRGSHGFVSTKKERFARQSQIAESPVRNFGSHSHMPPADGKKELSQRWFAQLPVGPQTRLNGRHWSEFLGSSLDKVSAHTMAPDANLHCSACNDLLESQRYVCMICGPTQVRSSPSDDGTQRDGPLRSAAERSPNNASQDEVAPPPEDNETSSSSESSSEAEDGPSPATSLGITESQSGYELCSACVQIEGATHAQTAPAPRHAFREVILDDQDAWREILFDDVVECSSCGDEVPANHRYKCLTCARFDLCGECFGRPNNLHSGHCFQSSLDRPTLSVSSSSLGPPAPLRHRLDIYRAIASSSTSTSSLLSRSPSRSKSAIRHVDCMCFGCLKEISGTRYHCSECQIDLCTTCETSDPASIMPQSEHERSHILLKIAVPLAEASAIREAGRQAHHLDRHGRGSGRRGRSPGEERDQWRPHHDFKAPPHARGEHGPHRRFHDTFAPRAPFDHGPPPFGHGPPPPFGPPGWPGPPRHHRGPPPPPSVYLINAGSGASPSPSAALGPLIPLPPASVCAVCSTALMGDRWLCASCPTTPPVELCSACESQAARMHDPSHIFAHLRKPPSRPPPPSNRLLRPLYDHHLLRDAHPMHRSVRCDACAKEIEGDWMHCGSCAESFDLCSPCYSQNGAKHDEHHIFLKFARAIDMSVFRALSGVGSSAPVPLLSFTVY